MPWHGEFIHPPRPLRLLATCLLLFLAAAIFAQPQSPDEEQRDAAGLRSVITAWASAWQSQFVEEYLQHYTPGFRGESYASHEAWREERRRRITEPDYIRIALDEFELVDLSTSTATLRVRLHYSRPGYADRTLKELELRRYDQGWQIANEYNLEVTRLPTP